MSQAMSHAAYVHDIQHVVIDIPPIYGGNWEQVSVYCTLQIFYSGYVAVWVAVISH